VDDPTKDTYALAVCDQLVKDANFIAHRGRVIYRNNYYSSIKLAKQMSEEYSWTIVGTIVPTDKKSWEDEDIPFLKLSNGARNRVKMCWYREAVLKVKTKNGKHYCIQCTTWRDKKQVCFLNTNQVGFSNGLSVKRHVKGQKKREEIAGPRAQSDYITFMNAVNRSNYDSADWSTTIRTNRYYLRILW